MSALLTLALILLAAACFGWVRTSLALGAERSAHEETRAEREDLSIRLWQEKREHRAEVMRHEYASRRAGEAISLNGQLRARLRVMEEEAAATYALPVYRPVRALKAVPES